ncbi:hypothetical protein AB6A40_007341 [Gnathostoma spinigerum]|uniref:Large ribosomal subunit protein uL24m n=1 Tax=Gnathostoma spinigerum TaxID=75299 RepID=A0ABD6EVN5_9BILA
MRCGWVCRFPRRFYADLDYARHFPKEYVEAVKRTVPRKTYDNRFGAPAIVHWTLHPDDYVPGTKRPWEQTELIKNIERSQQYQTKKLLQKFFKIRRKPVERIPDNEWTIFPGDLVEVMIGKDKGKQGYVSHVIRDANVAFVEGLHTILENEMEGGEKMGLGKMLRWKEQPLNVKKGQVKLVDPSNLEPCDAHWCVSESEDKYIRISNTSGFEIPIPAQAAVTYEYVSPEKYIEVEGKDTPVKDALEITYTPKLSTFEDDIMESMGLKDDRKRKPTYWY